METQGALLSSGRQKNQKSWAPKIGPWLSCRAEWVGTAKEKPWTQSAMEAAKEKSKSETASRELHSEMNQHRTYNGLLHLLCDGKSDQREQQTMRTQQGKSLHSIKQKTGQQISREDETKNSISK
jgi:hypothetical protein